MKQTQVTFSSESAYFFHHKYDFFVHIFFVHFITYYTVYLDESWPKMFLLYSHLIDEKFASLLTCLKSWRKDVLVFCKEHADWSNIGGVMIGWSWKIKFVKIHFFCKNVNLKSQKHPFYGAWDKNGWSHLVPREK